MAAVRNAVRFVALAALWGTAFMVIKAGLAFVPPVLFAAVRYDMAGLIVLGYVATSVDYWRPRNRSDWATVAVGSTLVIGLYNALLFVGEQGVTGGVAAILVALNPILASAFSGLLLQKERVGAAGVAGLLVGFAGVGLVVNPSASNGLISDIRSPLLVVAAAVCVALGSVLVRRLDSDISTEGTVAWSSLLGAAQLHMISFALPTESIAQVTWTAEAVAAVVYLGVFASAVGYFIYFDLLDRLGPIEINLVSYAAPVFAAVSGWIVLGETLTVSDSAGFAAIFVGFVLLKRGDIADAFAP